MVTSVTSAPLGSVSPRLAAVSSSMFWILTPSQPRLTEPEFFSCVDHVGRRLGGNGEGDADVAARRAVDGGVDAHHLAVEVEGRAAGVAAVHGRVDLHVVVGARADVAALRRDDAGRHGAAETERDCRRRSPSHQRAACFSANFTNGKVSRRLDLQQRDVGALVGADQLGVELVVLVEADLDLAAAVDDVVVGTT